MGGSKVPVLLLYQLEQTPVLRSIQCAQLHRRAAASCGIFTIWSCYLAMFWESNLAVSL